MAQFKFNLETVLRQRTTVEQLAQRAVAEARQKLVPLQEKLAELGRQRQQADDDMRQNRLVGTVDVSFIAGHRRFVIAMEQQALALARQIAEAQVLVDRAQAALLQAARARKAIDTLKDRQHERWAEAEAKKEAALLDEAGMQIAFDNLNDAGPRDARPSDGGDGR